MNCSVVPSASVSVAGGLSSPDNAKFCKSPSVGSNDLSNSEFEDHNNNNKNINTNHNNMANNKSVNMPPPRRTRRVSSSALYEVWRKDQKDVCYLYVPDEYVSYENTEEKIYKQKRLHMLQCFPFRKAVIFEEVGTYWKN